jgi:ABC-type phosphate transport system permease subunit
MSTVTRIKRIDPLQLGKILAVIYGLLSLIFVVPFFLMFLAASAFSGAGRNGFEAPTIMISGFGLMMIIIMPIMYAVMGFIAGVVGAFIYNVVAKWIGGIEVEFE